MPFSPKKCRACLCTLYSIDINCHQKRWIDSKLFIKLLCREFLTNCFVYLRYNWITDEVCLRQIRVCQTNFSVKWRIFPRHRTNENKCDARCFNSGFTSSHTRLVFSFRPIFASTPDVATIWVRKNAAQPETFSVFAILEVFIIENLVYRFYDVVVFGDDVWNYGFCVTWRTSGRLSRIALVSRTRKIVSRWGVVIVLLECAFDI